MPVVGLVTATAVIPAATPEAVSAMHPGDAQAHSRAGHPGHPGHPGDAQPARAHPRAAHSRPATRPPLPARRPSMVSRAKRPALAVPHGAGIARHAAVARPLRASDVGDATAAALVEMMPTPPPDSGPAITVAPAPSDRSAGARIIAEARRYLGVPYVSNGATPDGFDCSGYTMWVYSHAGVAQLPHFADSQRQMFRQIPQSAARPGDLIFYLDGDYAYHVAIYAGYGMQYAAPAPGQDVKLEPIWSSDITFGTDWH